MTSGPQTDPGTGDTLSPDPEWMLLIAQCWSESTRRVARGGWEQYEEREKNENKTHSDRKEKGTARAQCGGLILLYRLAYAAVAVGRLCVEGSIRGAKLQERLQSPLKLGWWDEMERR
ncbi:hypothetical protein Q8A67_021518 [Cirrhinus molitorella]|uniref:Uncharacterized protein n=1 Tax=Cirrhinus molitorella TaxID=172907 RepID=A0AA88P3P6_9TELE|nr:hypothetical protein Q8A67_021518 [Cirrhinus molitorella]